MRVTAHIVWAGAASLLALPVLGESTLIFGTAAVLIDGDHYLEYLHRNKFKDFSFKRTLLFHELLFENLKRGNSVGLNLLHTVEFQTLLGVAALLTRHEWLVAAFLGMLFHLVLDLANLYRQGVIFHRALSIIEYVIRWNRLKRRGQDPVSPYRATLEAMAARARLGKQG